MIRRKTTMNQTKIEYRNGDVYEGEVNENNDKHGWGKMTYLNGDVYEGEWKKIYIMDGVK